MKKVCSTYSNMSASLSDDENTLKLGGDNDNDEDEELFYPPDSELKLKETYESFPPLLKTLTNGERKPSKLL